MAADHRCASPTELMAEGARCASSTKLMDADAPYTSRILCIAGSLTDQTRAQTEYMRRHSYPVLCLDTTQLFDLEKACREKRRILEQCRRLYAYHTLIMIHAMQEDAQVALTKSLGAALGLSNTDVSQTVSDTLSELAGQISAEHKINSFIICGGDTSAAFCRHFGIAAMDIGPEIEPGIPICIHNDAPHERLVLKSGSFGSDAFIEKAVLFCNHLNREMTQ